MKKFDPELARKAQIAHHHKLPINFQQLDQIGEILLRLLKWKKQLEAARQVATFKVEVSTSQMKAQTLSLRQLLIWSFVGNA